MEVSENVHEYLQASKRKTENLFHCYLSPQTIRCGFFFVKKPITGRVHHHSFKETQITGLRLASTAKG